MKHALIKDGIVVNIIDVDNDSLREKINEEKPRMESFKKAMAKYEKATLTVDEAFQVAVAELAAAQANKDKDLIKEAKKKVASIRWPKAPARVIPPKGLYHPPVDHEMIVIEGQCEIGWEYKDGGFHEISVDKEK